MCGAFKSNVGSSWLLPTITVAAHLEGFQGYDYYIAQVYLKIRDTPTQTRACASFFTYYYYVFVNKQTHKQTTP